MSMRNYISFVLLVLASLGNFSCEKNNAQGQPLNQTPAQKNTRLNNLLSATKPDFAYVAKLLPQYYECIELVFKDEATRAMLKPVFEHASDFAKTISQKPKPYSAVDTKTHDKNINELSTQIEKSIAQISKTHVNEFDTCLTEKESLAQEELREEREKARAVIADFSVTEEDFILIKMGSDFKNIDFEAFAKYLDTKFRVGLESVKKIVDASADFDALVKAVDEINLKATESPDFKKFSDARDVLNTKIAQSLDKKINQGQKDDLMKEYFGIAVYDQIKKVFQTVNEKTRVVREKIQLIEDAAALTTKHLEEAIIAADEAIVEADISGLDADNKIILAARKIAQEAYVLAASSAKDQAENHQALAERAKTEKKSSEAAYSAKVAKEFFDTVKLLKTKEPKTASDIDATEKAHTLAQTASADALLAEPASKVAQTVNDALQDVTKSFTALDTHLKNLPEATDDAATVTNIIKEGDKISNLIDVAILKVSTAKRKGLDVSLFNKSIADSEAKVKKAYETAAQTAKTIAEAQAQETQAQHAIIKDVMAHIALITKAGALINALENKNTLNKIQAANDAISEAKNASDRGDKIAGAVKNKFVLTLALDAKSIGDQAVAVAAAARKAYNAAQVDLAQLQSDYDNKVVPVVKKTKVITTAVDQMSAVKKLTFKGLTDSINALKEHDITPEIKAEQFKNEVKAVVDKVTGFRDMIQKASDEIKLVRNHKKIPVLDTDPLLLKANAEDVIDGLNQEIAKLEAIIVAKALAEVIAFKDLAKKYSEDVEVQKAVTEHIFTDEDGQKIAAQLVNTHSEKITGLVHATSTLDSSLRELKDPLVIADKKKITQAIQNTNDYAEIVSDALLAVNRLPN